MRKAYLYIIYSFYRFFQDTAITDTSYNNALISAFGLQGVLEALIACSFANLIISTFNWSYNFPWLHLLALVLIGWQSIYWGSKKRWRRYNAHFKKHTYHQRLLYRSLVLVYMCSCIAFCIGSFALLKAKYS